MSQKFPSRSCYQFAIDVGGTFTDCLASSPTGEVSQHKVLSSGVFKGRGLLVSPTTLVDPARRSDPKHFWRTATLRTASGESKVLDFDNASGTLTLETPITESPTTPATQSPDNLLSYELTFDLPAPILIMRWVLQLPGDQPLPTVDVRLGTTRGTNALLTRTGARTAWVTTRGFKDLLLIGDQDRPKLFDLEIRKPAPLFEATAEIDERLDAQGKVLLPLDITQATRELQRLKDQGIETLAIALMHSYRNGQHERQLARIARELGFEHLRLSHQVAPLIKLVARGRTTVVDAYLEPILRDYLRLIRESLGPGSRLMLMTSAGDLVEEERFSGKDSLLSGPAGGVVGLGMVSQRSGQGRGIGFDMGGTSTDVSRYDGKVEIEYETRKADVPLVVPTLAIETVAAGGGSICRVEDGRYLVGPASAGAVPGPACYGQNGLLTVTDLNVWLGRVPAEHFPFPLDTAAIRRRLCEQLGIDSETSGPVGDTPGNDSAANTTTNTAAIDTQLHAAAQRWLRIADAKMASAIRSVSIAKGYDARSYPLVAFGGAAAQHACGVADELGMTTILCPPEASILSAAGIAFAQRSARTVKAIYEQVTDPSLSNQEPNFQQLEQASIQTLRPNTTTDTNIPNEQPIQIQRAADLRYQGTDSALRIDRPADNNYLAAFERLHEQRFGYRQNRPIELVALHITATESSTTSFTPDPTNHPPTLSPQLQNQTQSSSSHPTPTSKTTTITHFENHPHATPIYERSSLTPNQTIPGPALITDPQTTVVLAPSWTVTLLPSRTLKLTKSTANPSPCPPCSPCLNTYPELFANSFQAIAEQMGLTLRNTASSVNVKERLDFSCAIFDSQGHLVVNAPHIPVHLGAMSETVRCLVRDEPSMNPGDVFLTNDPYLGGSHLPDLTVVTPVFIDHHTTPSFFVASRAHHAEIGGLTPGSMPPFSKRLGEEGVILRHVRIIAANVSRLDSLREALAGRVPGEDRQRIIAEFPSRSPDENIADIRAQIAANRQGARELERLCAEQGQQQVAAAMQQLQQIARQRLARVLAKLGEGTRSFADTMDDGSRIQVSLTIAQGRLTIDFTGSAPVHPRNLNANRGIVTAAVMYVLRCLMTHEDRLAGLAWQNPLSASGAVGDTGLEGQTDTTSHTGFESAAGLESSAAAVGDTGFASNTAAVVGSALVGDTHHGQPNERAFVGQENAATGIPSDTVSAAGNFDIPLNHGLLEQVEIQIPEGMLAPPHPSDPAMGAAVVGGNVETSQRIVDVLLAAIGIAAASQGTMNNLLFGNERFGYYETICGGAGATAWADGADAVHTHMTNTRITDPEVLEHRFPVRLNRFEIRRGSGGQGHYRGGDGVTREFEFLEPLELSLLTNRRPPHQPFGLHGANPGQSGENQLTLPDHPNTPIQLPHATQQTLTPNTHLKIQTPGAGAYNPPT